MVPKKRLALFVKEYETLKKATATDAKSAAVATAFEKFIAPIRRFYYFDTPTKYAALAAADPPMAVSSLGKFFGETADLVAGRF